MGLVLVPSSTLETDCNRKKGNRFQFGVWVQAKPETKYELHACHNAAVQSWTPEIVYLKRVMAVQIWDPWLFKKNHTSMFEQRQAGKGVLLRLYEPLSGRADRLISMQNTSHQSTTPRYVHAAACSQANITVCPPGWSNTMAPRYAAQTRWRVLRPYLSPGSIYVPPSGTPPWHCHRAPFSQASRPIAPSWS
jgi:hypothetical protein